MAERERCARQERQSTEAIVVRGAIALTNDERGEVHIGRGAILVRGRSEQERKQGGGDLACSGSGVGGFALGAQVEVRMEEDGLLGSLYSARVLKHKGRRSLVMHRALLSEEGTPLQEWVRSSQLRALPRPTPPQFAEGLRTGDAVELKLNDAWWEVRLVRSRRCKNLLGGGKEFLVASDVYHTEHWVRKERLRPSLAAKSDLGGASPGAGGRARLAAALNQPAASNQPAG